MAQYKGAASEAGRAMQLMKKREKEREQLEQLKQRIAEDNMVKSNIDKKFSAHYDAVEAELKSSTVGLVTLNDMKAKQEALVKEREKQLAKKEQSKELQLKLEKQKEKKRKEEQKRKIASLSFNPEDDGEDEEEEDEKEEEEDDDDEEEEQEYVPVKKKKLGKNPDVDTSFLPDRDREEEENRLREELRQEWELKQEKIKSEEIEITFSYWDGSGHRKTVKMKKGNTIQNFLQRALEVLRKDFSELRSAGVEQLMYIKEDLIIPHHHSFYDFIVTKARGKSGPLFSFDVHDDIRLVNDATVEKDESHAGKVVLRSWYEKNKHIFPASRWEPYDPEKKWDKYTVSFGFLPQVLERHFEFASAIQYVWLRACMLVNLTRCARNPSHSPKSKSSARVYILNSRKVLQHLKKKKVCLCTSKLELVHLYKLHRECFQSWVNSRSFHASVKINVATDDIIQTYCRVMDTTHMNCQQVELSQV
uniref:Family with sequence similarity 50 member A n=1 Tax=Hippocampus comes TaxID=109280 RepID=A0A3Q2Y003_HIPCM